MSFDYDYWADTVKVPHAKLTDHLLKSGFVKSRASACVEAQAILEIVHLGEVYEYAEHWHYPVPCDYEELKNECVTVHSNGTPLHTLFV